MLDFDQHLKNITRKGMTWELWAKLPESWKAVEQLKTCLSEQVEFRLLDYEAALDPAQGRGIMLFIDACDYGWG